MTLRRSLLLAGLVLGVLALYFATRPPGVVTVLADSGTGIPAVTESDQRFRYEIITNELEHPWGMALLPDGNILVTERPGRLRMIRKGKLDPAPISGLPDIIEMGQGGLLDIILHPGYEQNGWIYFTYAGGSRWQAGTHVARARLQGHGLVDLQILFAMQRLTGRGQHFGSRLVFDREGYLYFTIGDRGEMDRAQDPRDHAGSVIRLHDDGSIPADNPYHRNPALLPEIFSYGHRNPQGMTRHPETGEIWLHEHGPQGGDELNRVAAGRNYGWPVITYGVNYGTGTRIGEGTHKAGMEQPVHYWVPSIAPSGMSFYQGQRFPGWDGDLLVGALKFQQLVRLHMDGPRVTAETRYLGGELGRIRDVRQGPDGTIYLLTDAADGKLVRLDGLAK